MPGKFYRRFTRSPNDIVKLGDDHPQAPGFRLASALFKTAELSVDNAEASTPEETAARAEGPAGVASIDVALLDALELTAEPDPVAGNAAHCLIKDINKSKARRLARGAKVVLPLPGVNVVDGGDE